MSDVAAPQFERPICPSEERANALTHALGLGLATAGAVLLLVKAAQTAGPVQIASCAVYVFTLIATYAASTLSHTFTNPRLRHAFRTADQALIFLFIVASWTAMATAWLNTPTWWILHGSMWVVALVGFSSKAFFTHRVEYGSVSTLLYLILGWMPVLAIPWFVRIFPVNLSLWLLAGGLSYTAGMFFFRLDSRVKYFHALWHLFVIAGTTFHYMGVLLHCTGTP